MIPVAKREPFPTVAGSFRGAFCEALDSRPGHRLQAGEFLYLPGDPITSSYYLRKGLIKTGVFASDGRELIVDIHRPGDIIGEPCLPEGKRGDYARAIEESDIVEVSCADFVDQVRRDPQALLDFMGALDVQLAEIRERLLSLASEPVRARLVRTLVRLAEKLGEETPEGVRIPQPIRQEDLARMVGARREVVSRELNRLRREGAIRYSSRGPIRIDRAALRGLQDALGRPKDDIGGDQ